MKSKDFTKELDITNLMVVFYLLKIKYYLHYLQRKDALKVNYLNTLI